MADGQRSGTGSSKRPRNMTSGSKSPTRMRAHPKGNVSPRSTRSGGSASPKSQRSPTSSAIQPLERHDQPRNAGGHSSPKQTGSPKRGASPTKLTEKPVKTLNQGKSPTPTGPNASGRASPNPAGTPTSRPSSTTSGVVPHARPGVAPQNLQQNETVVPEVRGNLSPKRRGSPAGLRQERPAPKPGDASPRRGSPKAMKSGSASPKQRNSPGREPSPVTALTSSTPPGSGGGGGPVPKPFPPGAPGNTHADVFPTGGGPPLGGAPASHEPMSAKDHVAATPPAADAGPSTASPAHATSRGPTISLKDPRYRHFTRALLADRGRRGANGSPRGTSSPKGRASPSVGTSYYASDDDETIIEFATSQVRRTKSGGLGRRRSGTPSPVTTQRSSILLPSPLRERLSLLGLSSKSKPSVPSSPQDVVVNEELSFYMIHGSAPSGLTSGAKYDGGKPWKPSLLVLTGAFVLALLFTAIIFFIALHMISHSNAPSRHKNTRNHTTNATANSPLRSGTGLASTADAYGILLRDAIDADAKPCDNFYRFACGSWKRNHPHTTSGAENLDYFVATALARLREVKADEEPIGKAVRYLDACLAAAKGEAANDLKTVLAEAGLTWPDRSEGSDFVSALFFMARRLALPVFFGVDMLHREGNRRHTLAFPLDVAFQSILRTLMEHIRSGHVATYLRLPYDSMAGNGISDNARFSEILTSLKDMNEVFEVYLNAFEKEEALGNVTSLLRIAPMVPVEKWNTLLQKYFGANIAEVDYVVVFDRGSFAAILGLLKTRGEDGAKDILGCLAVQAAIFYTKIEVRESFFGSSEEARDQQERHCFGDVHGLFRYAVDRFLFNGSEGALADVSELAFTIRDEFVNTLRSGALLRGQPLPYPEVTGFGMIFALPETSKPLGPLFGRNGTYPNVSPRPLLNRMIYAERLAKPSVVSVDTARRDVGDLTGLHQRERQGDVSYLGFRLAPHHLFFPWFSTRGLGHRAALYAGIGARLAAAMYFDYVQRRPFGPSRLIDNHRCLGTTGATGASDRVDNLNVSFGLELQAAVAGVHVAWRAYRRNVIADRDTPNTAAAEDDVLGGMTGSRTFFVFGCYLFCGEDDGERMCNVPARENADFARVFECDEYSSMKSSKKCHMFG
ncbi:hypothetical protein HPB52_008672 [Rhipicephalus sanguineus]|uniref:Peptidase M13 N-terminal domain-containing protein n=1 Tax=Rhipicephalus sanguineus TaxID=34632 RepID=A0A9D4QEF4_RHISA|nr:hypothetical protein HPB52_008672 [Rhipicephalus sanguineus]